MNRQTMKFLSGDASKAKRLRNQERNLTRMGITIVIVFVICNSFYVIYYILKSIPGILSTFDKLYLHSTARFFAIMNCSVNIIIYYHFNTQFRETLVSLFRPAKKNTEKQNTSGSARPISFLPSK